MNIKQVSYGRTKNTGNYTSIRADVVVEIDEEKGETFSAGLTRAKILVDFALGEGPSEEEVTSARALLQKAEVFSGIVRR